jgi:hypothetical protein
MKLKSALFLLWLPAERLALASLAAACLIVLFLLGIVPAAAEDRAQMSV